jgi:glycosyltransferase involved in cell wall biosynthesis
VKRLKVLIAAYACRPDKGSEPGVGWNMARELATHHEVWVLTRVNNQSAIDAELEKNPLPSLHIIYNDVPQPLRWWKQEHWEIHLHYYFWQMSAYATACKLHREINFDIVHHVTYGRYCDPSFLAFMKVPFVWGPVGGAESAPTAFWPEFGLKGRIYETLRSISRWIGENAPLTRATARRSAVAIAATPETATHLKTMGVQNIKMIPGQTGITQHELLEFKALATPTQERPIRFLSLGRLLHWKGFHLGLQAFSLTQLKDCEYWIIGDGPERQRLEDFANHSVTHNQITFLGNLPRDEALRALGECDILIHPSLHDFSPTVCLEAMAAGRPVICLDIGGPAGQITPETGIKISAHSPAQTVKEIADSMVRLASNPELRIKMGQAGQQRIDDYYTWERKGQFIAQLYKDILVKS